MAANPFARTLAVLRSIRTQTSYTTVRKGVRSAILAGLGCALAAGPAFAQFNTGGQTGFGQANAGGFGQTQGFGQTGQGGFGQVGGLGQTGFGQVGAGQAGFGQSGLGGFGQTGQAGQAGAAANPFGSGGMVGSTNSFGSLAGAALLNRGLQSSAGLGAGGFGAGGFGAGGRGGRGGLNSMNRNQNQNSDRPQIRATVKLGFDVPAPSSAEKSQTINERLSRIPSPMLQGVTVSMQGRTAIIRGEVESPSDGKTIERLLSLEPGVDAVKNELTFASGQGSGVTPASQVPPTPRPSVPNSVPSASQLNPASRPSGANVEVVPAPSLN